MKKILLIEDQTPILNALDNALESEEYEIIKARNGKTGLSVALRDRPDLILLDMLLPEMDGIDLLTKLRMDEWGRTAKVAVLSNLTHEEIEQKAQHFHILEYIVKSNVKIGDLVNKVKVWLA